MQVTVHAEKRIRKRFGVKRKAVENVVCQAVRRGKKISEYRGKVKKWYDYECATFKAGNNSVIFDGFCFVIQDEIVITAYEVPKHLRSIA